MGKTTEPLAVKLIVGMLAREEALFQEALARLSQVFGPVDFRSKSFPFSFTSYYEKEMGPELKRQFASFQRLIVPGLLASIKTFTNRVEGEFSRMGARRINLDPGYISLGKLVLATTKDREQRIYLGEGIYAEVTLRYQKGSFRPWEWTYPDYRSVEGLEILNHIRSLYRAQLQEGGYSVISSMEETRLSKSQPEA